MSLADRTIQDVLLHFGETKGVARRRYREFVEKGIKQGTREDLQGGGLVRPACHATVCDIGKDLCNSFGGSEKRCMLVEARAVRSAGGETAGLLGHQEEERDLPDSPEALDGGRGKGDARILGSGDFVNEALQQAESILEKKYLPKRPIEELIEFVANQTGIPPELISSGSRKARISDARSILAHMAVEEIGHPAAEVARFLGISRMGVQKAAIRGRQFWRHQELVEQ